MNAFELKFGKNFLSSIPTTPGVYRIYDGEATLIYVGKAKNLRRRLGQYKNAKRCKKHRKMRKIVEKATSIQLEACHSEYQAEVLETQLIQSYRPKWNVVGAFYFLYPLIGMRYIQGSSEIIEFCYTTQPEYFSGFSFHGAFRSRQITGEAFFSLMKLLPYIGHSLPKDASKSNLPKYSYLYGFRQLPLEWSDAWSDFWQGKSKDILERLVLALIENAKARQKSSEIQEHLNNLAHFWRHEASQLLKVRTQIQHPHYPVNQRERDFVFLKYRRKQDS